LSEKVHFKERNDGYTSFKFVNSGLKFTKLTHNVTRSSKMRFSNRMAILQSVLECHSDE